MSSICVVKEVNAWRNWSWEGHSSFPTWTNFCLRKSGNCVCVQPPNMNMPYAFWKPVFSVRLMWRRLIHGIAGWKGPLLGSKSSYGQKEEHGNTAYNAGGNVWLVQSFSVSVLFVVSIFSFNWTLQGCIPIMTEHRDFCSQSRVSDAIVCVFSSTSSCSRVTDN